MMQIKVKRWEEPRTPGGRWSFAKRYKEEEQIVDKQWLENFFAWRFEGERRQYTYTKFGYKPYRVTYPSYDRSYRVVVEFDYFDDEEVK